MNKGSHADIYSNQSNQMNYSSETKDWLKNSVIFVNENENENGEKRENNEFVNEN